MERCKWVNLKNKIYVDYHDNEWGKIEHNDSYLFEMIILEGFQAGLSWECILNKREDFRKAFDNFDYKKISKYDSKKINELINNPNIIRNKLKHNEMLTPYQCSVLVTIPLFETGESEAALVEEV